jgi:hypothetical protein
MGITVACATTNVATSMMVITVATTNMRLITAPLSEPLHQHFVDKQGSKEHSTGANHCGPPRYDTRSLAAGAWT